MNKKQEHSGFSDIFGPNTGTWILILVHLFLLFALVVLFGALIEHIDGYL